MADITNKNELKRRIELFLDELDYSINEDFCKETMKMMREFIVHASHRLNCEESRVKSLKSKLKNYKDLEEQGLLLRLPCKAGSMVYLIRSRYTECSKYKETWNDCYGCEDKDKCDSHEEYYIHINHSVSDEWIVRYMNDFGKTVFLTQAEAEQKLKEMESD